MPRNIVLIVLDTVRKDRFDKFAHRLQNLGDVSFDECRAPSCWSVPSHASFFTGLLPSQHGIHTHNQTFAGLDPNDTFLGDLSEYNTLSVSANVYASSTFGFDQLFDKHVDVAPHRRFSEGMDMEKFMTTRTQEGWQRFPEFIGEAIQHDYTLKSLGNGLAFKLDDLLDSVPLPKFLDDGANLVHRRAKGLIEETAEPFFLFTNFMDAHAPHHHIYGYDKSFHDASNTWSSADFENQKLMGGKLTPQQKEHLRHHRDLYGAAIDYLDKKVSAFIQKVQTMTSRETTFIITADHGENMRRGGDNSLIGHSSSLTEGVTHVPFVVVNPPEPINDPGLFTLLDLPTVVQSWAIGNNDVPSREHIPAEVVGQGIGEVEDEHWDRMIRCVYKEDTKIEWDSLGRTIKYTLPQKPSVHHRVKEGLPIPEYAKSLFDVEIKKYKHAAKTQDEGVSVNRAVEDRMKRLGYL